MKSTDKLMDMLCAELDEIAEKGQLSAGDLDTVHKLIVSKEKLLRCEELEADLGYSEAGEWMANGSYGNNSYGNHSYRNSYARRGRRYSMAEGKDMMMEKMRDIMNDPSLNPNDRQVLERAMRELGR